MKRGLFLLPILLALILATAACGGSSDERAPAATAAPVAAAPVAAPQEAAPAATNTPIPPTAIPLPPTPAAEDEEPVVERLAALEQLDSYRMQMTYTTTGFDIEDKPVDNRAEILTEYTRNPAASWTVFTMIDDTATDMDERMFNWEIYQIDQDMYMSMGDEMGWIRTSAEESPLEDGILGAFSGGDFFTNLDQMQRVRPDERINGVDSRHYRFDERVLASVFGEDAQSMSAAGDVWIAKDGDYITKYVVTITYKEGQGGFSGELVTGTIEIAFEVKDVNTPFTIEIPADATAGARLAGFEGEDFPVPPGARVEVASANFTIIESDAPVAEVIAFYEEALAALGWTKDEQGSFSMGDMASTTFSKDGVQMSLVVSLDSSSGKTQIMVSAQ